MLIAACPNRFNNGVAPIVFPRDGEQAALFAFDGSGSWGSGAETTAWFREWIAATVRDSDDLTPEAVNETLVAAIRELPSDLTDCDFGWTFSLAVILCRQDTVHVAASGSFAAIALNSRGIERLVVPTRLVDELVAHGTISAEEAETHRYRRIICSPCFGADNLPRLIWSQPISWAPGDRIALGDAALPRFLETRDFRLDPNNPIQLRDAVERYGGSSTSTAIVGFPACSG